ncbi:MAG: GAF domain-containing protein [Deltaproteobacteria bacterium]|nr:GAF domain-containing protein [Deltaproteobacteria bacterium]
MVKYILAGSISPVFLAELLSRAVVSNNLEIIVSDKNKKVLATNRNTTPPLGKPETQVFPAKSHVNRELTWQGVTVDGSAVQVAASRSNLSGWIVRVAIPHSVTHGPVQRSLMLVAGGGLLLLGIGILIAIAFGRRISDPIAVLSEATARLERGEALQVPTSRISEVNRLASALEKANVNRTYAEEQLRSRYEEIKTIHQISQWVLSFDSLQSVLDAILEKAIQIGGFDIGSIRLLNNSREVFHAGSFHGYRDPANISHHHRSAKGPAAGMLGSRVIAERKSIVLENVDSSEGIRTLKREGVRSAVLVPIFTQEREVMGIIQLGSRTPREFSPDEIHFLKTVGTQMGVAVQKGYLYEKITNQSLSLEKSNKELEIRSWQQLVLGHLGHLALAQTNLSALFDETVFLVSQTLQTDHCEILERLPGGEEFLLRARDGKKAA